MYDLIGGRATWTAFGLPTVGEVGDHRRISHYVQPASTVDVSGRAGDVQGMDGPVAVLGPGGVLVGSLDASTVGALPVDTAIAPIMVPAPGTIRPELRIEEVATRLRDDSLEHVFVTTIGGVLLGIVRREDLHV